MTVYEAQQQLQTALTDLYDDREAANITDWVMEHVTGLRKIDRIMHKQSPLAPEKAARLQVKPSSTTTPNLDSTENL